MYDFSWDTDTETCSGTAHHSHKSLHTNLSMIPGKHCEQLLYNTKLAEYSLFSGEKTKSVQCSWIERGRI